MSLDEKLKKLKTITELLDTENITFEEGVKLYEEGVLIAKDSMKILNESKGKITKIKQDLESFKEEELN